ncbi:MAG: phosphoglycerate mutase family protein [Balneolaceae bacterium]|nr:phosphoglycerate mutase family protein [Balneolaceae bacterium]
MIKRFNGFLFLIVLFSAVPLTSVAQTDEPITTFILVRHAEKVDDSADPELSPEGKERVALLTEMLAEVSFDAVYSTPLIRTRETARPIAEERNLEILDYNPRNLEQTANRFKEEHPGETILISGHSNTTPMFANALLGREHFTGSFDESDYGNLLIITVTESGDTKLIHLRF